MRLLLATIVLAVPFGSALAQQQPTARDMVAAHIGQLELANAEAAAQLVELQKQIADLKAKADKCEPTKDPQPK
jgi:hypothetical protein